MSLMLLAGLHSVAHFTVAAVPGTWDHKTEQVCTLHVLHTRGSFAAGEHEARAPALHFSIHAGQGSCTAATSPSLFV